MRHLTTALLMVLFLFTALPALAQVPAAPADLAGSWTYTREASGYVYKDALELAVAENGPAGTTTYMDDGAEQHETFRNFEIAATGRVTFVAERPDGTLAAHKGEFTADGRSIRGSYDIGMGVGGAFVLSRAGAPCPEIMDHRWKCHVQDPKGGAGLVLTGALLGDSTGFFKGYLYVDYGSCKTVEGTLGPDGSLHIDIYGSENFSLQGTLAPEGETTMGLWKSSKGQAGSFTLERINY